MKAGDNTNYRIFEQMRNLILKLFSYDFN